ncbi:MAG: hypothetical protein QNK05_02925 [Myxococcota bacterium]|nr:hypothetical protein [Myxococcota bacterium]
MFRLKLVMVFLGGIVAFLGFQERTLSEGATQEPLAVTLEDLESGQVPTNPHLEVGEHWRTNAEIVFRYEQPAGEPEGQPSPKAKVDYAYYPIFSDSLPGVNNLANLTKLYGGADKIPESQLPEVGDFAVIVKTKRFKTVAQIPTPGWERLPPVRGLVINRIESLRSDEAALVQQGFPAVDLTKVLILEEGREPASATRAMSMMGGGAGLSLLGVGSLFVRRRS